MIDGTLSEGKFSGRQSALRKQTKKTHELTIPFVTTYHLAVKDLKQLDARMESNTQSVNAEKHLQNASYHIIQRREIT